MPRVAPLPHQLALISQVLEVYAARYPSEKIVQRDKLGELLLWHLRAGSRTSEELFWAIDTYTGTAPAYSRDRDRESCGSGRGVAKVANRSPDFEASMRVIAEDW
jgi:hypothetical protein